MEGMSVRRAFWIFASVIVMITIAERVLFIILPLYLIGLEFSATEIGLTFAAGGAVLAVFRFILGKLSDIKGRKRMMSAGLLADSLATAFYPAASGIAQFSLIRGIKDVAYNVTSTMEDALIGDSFPRDVRPRMLARLGTLFPLGRALAAVIGFLAVTYLSVIYGFYIAAISLFIGFLVFTVFYKERRLERITSYRLSFRNIPRATALVSLIGLSNSMAFSVAYVPGVFLLAGSLGLTEGDLFLMFLMSYIVSSLFAWRTGGWIKRHGREFVLGAGALGYGLFTMAYSLAASTHIFFIALLGVSISFYVYRIGYKTALLDSTDKRHRGEQVGFSKMLVSLGGIAGPVMGGLLIDGISLQAAFLVAGSFGMLGLVLALALRQQNKTGIL